MSGCLVGGSGRVWWQVLFCFGACQGCGEEGEQNEFRVWNLIWSSKACMGNQIESMRKRFRRLLLGMI